MKKCNYTDINGNTVKVLPDGVNELDPCEYEEVERYRNVTVSILRCKKCGHISIGWERQENTVEE